MVVAVIPAQIKSMKLQTLQTKIAFISGMLTRLGTGYGVYLFFLPHRDVRATTTALYAAK